MTSPRFAEHLNVQIGNEFAAQHQYIACAVYYDALTMPRMAALFYAQALEERGHAMMMVQYLLDTDFDVRLGGVDAPVSSFSDIVDPVSLALEQEKRVATEVHDLTRVAREEHDYASEQFMAWFIKEQVEEISNMSDLLTIVQRAKGDIEAIEEYVARETKATGTDPMSPRTAGI